MNGKINYGKLRLYKKIKIKNYLEIPFYLRNPLTKLTMQSHNLDSGAHGGH